MLKRKGCVSTWLLILRVVLWLIFIYHGVMKFNNPGMVDFIGWAAAKLWLGFFSNEVWFNIVKYVEVIWWAFLVLGLWTCLSALVLFVVMLVAINTKGRSLENSELDIVIAWALLALMFTGAGRYALTHSKWCGCGHRGCNCKDGKCNCSTDKVEEVIVEKTIVETD